MTARTHGSTPDPPQRPRSRSTTPPWSEGQRPVAGSLVDTSVPVTWPRSTASGSPAAVRAKTMSMRWSKSLPVASSTVSLRPEVQPSAAGAHFSHSSVKSPGAGDQLVRRLVRQRVLRLDAAVERVGVAVADEDRRGVLGRRLVQELGGLRVGDVRAERLEVGVDEPEPLRAGPDVDPLVPAVEADRVAQQRDLEVHVVHRLALVERRQPVLDVHQHDVAHGQPDVAGVGAHGAVERTAGEARRLDVRAGGDADRHVLDAPTRASSSSRIWRKS